MKKQPISQIVRHQIEEEWVVKCDYVQVRPLTVFILVVTFRDREYVGLGLAQCLSTDEWDTKFGYDTAKKRAERYVQRKIFDDFFRKPNEP